MSRPLVQITGLSKDFGYHQIFTNVDWLIREGEKIGFVGANGVGKSTVLKIIAGEDTPSKGSIIYYQDLLQIEYVPQNPVFPGELTPQQLLTHRCERLGAAAQAGVLETLSRFGFAESEKALLIANLSGGQRTRLSLAQAWLSCPGLLLLDEPTNHLDQEGLAWLEGFVKDYPGTVVVVSHDRYFLDQVVDRIVELTPKGAKEFVGTYSDYRQAKAAAYQQQLARYEAAQKEVKRIEAAISRQMEWADRAHRDSRKKGEGRMGVKEYYRKKAKGMARRVKSTIKRLEAMKETQVEKPQRERSIAALNFQESAGGRRMILGRGLAKSFAKELFTASDFTILRGDKVGVVGANGAGKTTLAKMILGEEQQTEGELWVSPGAHIGYLDQELEILDPTATILEGVLEVFPQQTPETITWVRTMLAGFLFAAQDLEKSIAILSTGERKRVALLRLLLSEYNLLILDEPTEHLDLPSRERLEDALVDYSGTLVLISHDRYLLRRVATKILAIESGRIHTYDQGFEQYHASRNRTEEPKGNGGESDPEISVEERLLWQNRLATLNSQLAFMDRADPEYSQLEAEFLELSRKLRKG